MDERHKVTKKIKDFIKARDGYICKYCGRTEGNGLFLCIDHIFPISLGGTSDLDNLQTLCNKCNQRKSNKPEEEVKPRILLEYKRPVKRSDGKVFSCAIEAGRSVGISVGFVLFAIREKVKYKKYFWEFV